MQASDIEIRGQAKNQNRESHILATYQLYSQNAGELIIVGTAQASHEVEGH